MVHFYEKKVTNGDVLPLYGAKRVIISTSSQCTLIGGNNSIPIRTSLSGVNTIGALEFPVINGLSPNSVRIGYTTSTGDTYVSVFILELGGIPSDDYWDL